MSELTTSAKIPVSQDAEERDKTTQRNKNLKSSLNIWMLKRAKLSDKYTKLMARGYNNGLSIMSFRQG